MRRSQRSETQSILRRIDWPTVLIYLAIVICGVFSIYAASYDFDHANIFSFDEFSGKQIRWIGLALVIGFVILLIDSRMYETYAFPIYVLVILVLCIVPFVGQEINGSKSWIKFGSMSLQPAEFAKFATALALAKLFSGYQFSISNNFGNFLKAVFIIILPVGLILMENETGSALTFMALFFVLYREGMSGLILFAAAMSVTIFVIVIKFAESSILGIPAGEFITMLIIMVTVTAMSVMYSRRGEIGRNLLIWFASVGLIEYVLTGPCELDIPTLFITLASIGVACIYICIEAVRHRRNTLFIAAGTAVAAVIFMFTVNFAFNKLQHHQQQRINVVLGIEQDLRGSGYNVNQSKIAIGSGGFFGKGFLNGTQTKLKYVPEQHTDFIFCTIGEERGFVGTFAIVALYIALILRVISIAERQPKTFGRVYAYCVASYFIFHFCINIGMVIGLCPVIGIPLPFLSYGGSSLWGFTILLFILLKLDASRRQSASRF